MRSLFDDWFTFTPSFDFGQGVKTEEKEDEYIIKLDAAGISKSAITVSVEGGFLVVKGEGEWKKIDYKFYLPENSDLTNIGASTLDGILTIEIKKTKEKELQRIEVL